MKKNLFVFALVIVGLLSVNMISGFIPRSDKKPWPVPDAFKNKKNPVASNATSISAGKDLWSTHCKSCHGAKGLGDGNKASQLKTEPGDFSNADTQSQTDGSLFYKISEGRDDMPSFKKKLPDQEDIWNLVVFSRTLKK
jgi:mono/diheme cytochrome c family protein